DGASTSSSTLTVKTDAIVVPPNQAPSKPTNLAGTPTTTSVALSWTASTDDKAVTGYNVFNGTTKVATVTGTTANVTGLTPDTSYTFKVEAFDAEGLKTASDATTVKTNKVVVPPVDAKAPVVKSIIGKVAFAKIGGIALVQGTNFTGVKSVTVGGKPVSVSPLGSNLLLVVLPPLAKGSYPLVVTTAAGASATTSSTTIKYISLF
ncbi:MAG: fibronectin type III domain-containing protein, partial [Solirubrobacteraceae bacterium]|nr:fibronectin type III domain-containing protein [Solirubrobacteraceae bacterium]